MLGRRLPIPLLALGSLAANRLSAKKIGRDCSRTILPDALVSLQALGRSIRGWAARVTEQIAKQMGVSALVLRQTCPAHHLRGH